ncbi:hypothetical protein NQ315_009640 [Exocentrus adspersus]|uniref:RNA polymerase alpha subunit n=1 Tax=Exocentrus adspersus TaxID=1586481 RepID=A0AAV8WI28_9CUCU|nr:hypothetical protein NQ315_009640 [Exocentrus adspersus]
MGLQKPCQKEFGTKQDSSEFLGMLIIECRLKLVSPKFELLQKPCLKEFGTKQDSSEFLGNFPEVDSLKFELLQKRYWKEFGTKQDSSEFLGALRIECRLKLVSPKFELNIIFNNTIEKSYDKTIHCYFFSGLPYDISLAQLQLLNQFFVNGSLLTFQFITLFGTFCPAQQTVDVVFQEPIVSDDSIQIYIYNTVPPNFVNIRSRKKN